MAVRKIRINEDYYDNDTLYNLIKDLKTCNLPNTRRYYHNFHINYDNELELKIVCNDIAGILLTETDNNVTFTLENYSDGVEASELENVLNQLSQIDLYKLSDIFDSICNIVHNEDIQQQELNGLLKYNN